jgi:cell division protein FtsL
VIKLSSLLASLLIVCALALVTSQHKARGLFSELTREQEAAMQLDVEWGQLQLEQSTWAMHARIERIATARLQMHMPAAPRVRLVFDEVDGYPGLHPEGRTRLPDRMREGDASATERLRAKAKR